MKINHEKIAVVSMLLSSFLIFTIFSVYERFGTVVGIINMSLAVLFCIISMISIKKSMKESNQEVQDLIEELRN